MPTLSDTQTILLSAAAQRDDRSLYPLPPSLNAGAHIPKAVAALIAAGFAEQRETNERAAISRTDGDLSFGAFATLAGLAAIGIEPEVGNDSAVVPEPAGGTDKPRVIYRRSFVNALLESLSGVTDVHEDAARELTELLQPKKQIDFLEKLCRGGQQDGETAFGVVTTLSPEQSWKKAPWCQILVEFYAAEDADGEDDADDEDPADEPVLEALGAPASGFGDEAEQLPG